MAELANYLPANHFGCHPGRTTTNSLHYVVKLTKDTWRKGEVISTLFMTSRAHSQCYPELTIHDMRLEEYQCNTQTGSTGKCTAKGHPSPFMDMHQNQECYWEASTKDAPYQALHFQFYIVDLIDICNKKSRWGCGCICNDTTPCTR